ncbi:hypothetical protein [Alicyclobacillus fodiniaquatilis]|jgi:TRAP-type C4-dicarboxylate transport system permease small subunit|uniref:Uncharacterized protein n=1 Tax=Alicyclobacillus fodiniaquatilis TaxID=1661150 RepID=A0ABW4JEU6_9BACL
MSYGFPDWMFAAIGIAAYELATWFKHQFHFSWAMWVAYGIIAVCALILFVRYLIRFIRRKKRKDSESEEDWRDF